MALSLKIKEGGKVFLEHAGEEIAITVRRTFLGSATLAFDAPTSCKILREELRQKDAAQVPEPAAAVQG